MGKKLKLCKVHSFSTSPNSRHHTTVLNTDSPNCYTQWRRKVGKGGMRPKRYSAGGAILRGENMEFQNLVASGVADRE